MKPVRIAPPASEEFTEAVSVDGFPYKLIYRERTDDLYIVAVAHASRRPRYWKQRR